MQSRANRTREEWRAQVEYFESIREQLLEDERNRFVAIHDGEVVGSGDNKFALGDEMDLRFPDQVVLITLVTEHPRKITIRSPHDQNDDDHDSSKNFVEFPPEIVDDLVAFIT